MNNHKATPKIKVEAGKTIHRVLEECSNNNSSNTTNNSNTINNSNSTSKDSTRSEMTLDLNRPLGEMMIAALDNQQIGIRADLVSKIHTEKRKNHHLRKTGVVSIFLHTRRPNFPKAHLLDIMINLFHLQ